ncbi:phosphonate ABC transporter, permease protein PhnE [Paenibacillus filicis]|uniref:Phosphonate ABC transporter, permease protein PhnE n=1 Tax=Paenibacillus gyeongsangnamensis TaxID=3388067 RepID=A0ABT4QJD7_9BACL|nr:phosphonate ABC transporter, permease protein PhnE [Paenibacillus filicis]MCZ8516973.1 phosphonate ABC transporter, permease protein PhnE [Paenibacillus filicis]
MLNRRRAYMGIIFVIAFMVLVWSANGSQIQVLSTLDLANLLDFLKRWWPPSLSAAGPAVRETIVTVQMAVFSTFIALVLGFLTSLAAASNISPHRMVYAASRGLLSFLRAVPVVVFGLLFVPLVGLGPLGGVLAMILHNWGVLGKLIAERIEASDRGPQEAVISTGSTWLPMVVFGLLPQVLPHMLSDAFYRLEVNVRDTMVLGFIGAGGIGNELFVNFKSFDYPSTTTDVVVIMILVIVIEIIGAYVRRRVN